MPKIETPEGPVYPGIWVGKVLKVDDAPMSRRTGKLRVEIPDVYGENVPEDKLPWAYPIFPGSVNPDKRTATFFSVPGKDSRVAVLFERGDPQSPRWIGGWAPPGRIPFQLQFGEGDDWPNIVGTRLEDGMMFRMVPGKSAEFILGKSGEFQDGEFVPDGEHNEYDTFIKLDKKQKKIQIRSKCDIDLQCKGKISIRATQIRIRVMPNQESDGEGGWQNEEGSETPRWELNVFDPDAQQGAQIRLEPGKMTGRARNTQGFEDS